MLNKEEKAKLTAIESAYWKNERMVKHCVNNAMLLYNWRGKTVVVDKKSIETRFCFGYSDSRYNTDDYDRANAMAEYARKNEQYFIKENHKEAPYAWTINALNNWSWKAYARPRRCGECPDLYSIDFCREYEEIPKGGIELTDEEKQAYKAVLVKAVKEHHKKIMAYLKRYGMSKVETWSYWRDE